MNDSNTELIDGILLVIQFILSIYFGIKFIYSKKLLEAFKNAVFLWLVSRRSK
jgi:hypothetical protein